ncbi:hypothetical protein [Dietzia sp.]|uniref:hypothetical protein n=1 Tax=Dietzia sp. TaxID=1871616 RepID=UPI002FDA6BCB
MQQTITTEGRHDRRGRLAALVALPAAALLSISLAACSSDGDGGTSSDLADAAASHEGDANSGKSQPFAGSASKSSAPAGASGDPANPVDNRDIAGAAGREGNDPGAAGSDKDAPSRSNSDLLLRGEDFPGWNYQTIDPSEGVAAAQKISEAMRSLKVDPPECTDIAVGSPAIPDGAAAAQIQDPASQSVYSVMVLGKNVDRGAFADRFLNCPTFTLSGSGLTMHATNGPTQTPKIEKANVQGYQSSATSRVDALDQEQAQSQTFYQVTTRGITFRVSALQMAPTTDEATIKALNGITSRQASKILDA